MSPTRIHTNAARSNTRTAGQPSARFVVGDYVGRAPGEAAYAVWRAGLLARLDRLAGHGPVLTARIAAQEPEPGRTLGRGGVVTLFIVAPEEDDVERADDAPSHRGDSLAASENTLELGASKVFSDEPLIDLCLCALALAVVTSRALDEHLRSIADALRRRVLQAEQQARALLALTPDAPRERLQGLEKLPLIEQVGLGSPIGERRRDEVAVTRGDHEGP